MAISASHRLEMQLAAEHNGAALRFDQLALADAARQLFSVSRLDFLLSDVALRRTDGSWFETTDWQAFISLREERSRAHIDAVPAGRYDRIRFDVGVRPELNHGNPARFPANHALNPNLNGLHWSWADGYVFLALEGHWQTPEGALSGYSFHLGNDPMRMRVELPVELTLDSDAGLRLVLHVDKVVDFAFADARSSTHARQGDPLAEQLKRNIEQAFTAAATLVGVPSTVDEPVNGAGSKSTVPIPQFTATPHRFTFPANVPLPELPRDNPLSQEGIALGRELFFEKRLSGNNTQSCASCHEPGNAFTDSRRFSIGAVGHVGSRNSMPLFNLAWKKQFFWDGRTATLREQVLEPIQNPIEMHELLPNVVEKLRTNPTTEADSRKAVPGTVPSPDYPALFHRAFGTREINPDRIARALEQFLLAQLSFDSKFDRALRGIAELSEEEKRGFELFVTEYDPRREQFGADCFHCHGGPLFTTHGFANNGLDVASADAGRFAATGNESDRGKFAIPSLRNVALTAPYMHDGRFQTLEEVVEHYARGVKRSATLDPNLAKHPTGGVPLDDADKRALIAFLKTLTDEKFPQWIPSAAAAAHGVEANPGTTASRAAAR